MGNGRIKMAVNIPCLNVQVIVIVIVIVQVTSFVTNVVLMRPSLDVVEENKALQRQITASVQLGCNIVDQMGGSKAIMTMVTMPLNNSGTDMTFMYIR